MDEEFLVSVSYNNFVILFPVKSLFFTHLRHPVSQIQSLPI